MGGALQYKYEGEGVGDDGLFQNLFDCVVYFYESVDSYHPTFYVLSSYYFEVPMRNYQHILLFT